MPLSLIELMAQCTDPILAATGINKYLDQHPEHAHVLRPLLETIIVEVQQLRSVPARSAAIANNAAPNA
ncbi:MAG: hypothetical protein ACUVR4_07075 [Anaerolineae bacterium]